MINRFTIIVAGKTISAQSAGEGENSIVFIHAASMSSATWLPQLNNGELQKKYRMIAIDLPGHGSSPWLEDLKGYGLKSMTEIVTEVISMLQLKRFIITAESYGTLLIGEIANPIKGCEGIMLVSTCIINDEVTPASIINPGPFGHVMGAADPSDEDLKQFIRYVVFNREIENECFDSYRNTDPKFREELASSTLAGGWSDELNNISKWNVPVCVVYGKEEKLINTDYLNNYPQLWNNKVYKIENAGHIVNEENAESFNAVLNDFAAAVFK